MSFGEKLAGINFNPSGNEHVDNVKGTAASFMDAIHSASWSNQLDGKTIDETHIKMRLFREAELRALEAQMLAVKAITWKDE